jgi:hypothetical protein
MSAVNKRYSHSFSQTTDDSPIPPQERDDDDGTASAVRADQAVTASDGMPV